MSLYAITTAGLTRERDQTKSAALSNAHARRASTSVSDIEAPANKDPPCLVEAWRESSIFFFLFVLNI